MIKNVATSVSWTCVISDLQGVEILGMFYEKKQQNANHKKFRVEKVIKREGDKIYIKEVGYGSSFNSWIHKKDIPEPKSLGARMEI